MLSFSDIMKQIKKNVASIAKVETDLSGKAPAVHSHENYADKQHTHDGYASSDHNHDENYAAKTHDHAGTYATAEHTHMDMVKSGDLVNYAQSNHNHDGVYAASAHEHDNYADTNHNHDTVYAGKAHDHAGTYATADHTHEGYAVTDHNHDENYAAKAHDHAGTYAEVNHNHDANYAAKTHNHDEDYVKIDDLDSLLPVTSLAATIKKTASGWVKETGDECTVTAEESALTVTFTKSVEGVKGVCIAKTGKFLLNATSVLANKAVLSATNYEAAAFTLDTAEENTIVHIILM